eukprot:9451030-Alexandrium_andersonii.AAC.1
MSASLVGSEMCIRDRPRANRPLPAAPTSASRPPPCKSVEKQSLAVGGSCLLYTSEAADDM